MNPFTPSESLPTVSVDTADTSANVKLVDSHGPVSVRVYNDGSATAWIAFGASDVAADASTSIPVAAGAREVLRVTHRGDGAMYVAAIAAAATGKIYFTVGQGGA